MFVQVTFVCAPVDWSDVVQKKFTNLNFLRGSHFRNFPTANRTIEAISKISTKVFRDSFLRIKITNPAARIKQYQPRNRLFHESLMFATPLDSDFELVYLSADSVYGFFKCG